MDDALNAIDKRINEVMSSKEERRGQLDSSLGKVSQPFEQLKVRQDQARASMDAAKSKVEASRNLLAAKELAFREGTERASNLMSQAGERAGQSKRGIEERQQELLKAEELVKSLIAKLESQAKSTIPVDASQIKKEGSV